MSKSLGVVTALLAFLLAGAANAQAPPGPPPVRPFPPPPVQAAPMQAAPLSGAGTMVETPADRVRNGALEGALAGGIAGGLLGVFFSFEKKRRR